MKKIRLVTVTGSRTNTLWHMLNHYKDIVDEIYDRESKLKYDYMAYSYDFHLLMAIEPWSFISKNDSENDLYITFLDHAKEIYRDRFKYHFEVDNA